MYRWPTEGMSWILKLGKEKVTYIGHCFMKDLVYVNWLLGVFWLWTNFIYHRNYRTHAHRRRLLKSQKKVECAVQILFTISCLHQRKK